MSMVHAASISSSFLARSGSISGSGRRVGPTGNPILFRAYLTGIGLDIQNSPVNKGIKRDRTA